MYSSVKRDDLYSFIQSSVKVFIDAIKEQGKVFQDASEQGASAVIQEVFTIIQTCNFVSFVYFVLLFKLTLFDIG